MSKSTILHTQWGNASVEKGYYRITSIKEGNYNKRMHRLVWEEFYGKPIPRGYVIHHMNGDKLDNRIQNLQLVENSKHSRFHNSGKIISEETRRKMSENNIGMLGKSHSEESKIKISESKKGVKHSLDSKKNMSKSRNTVGYFRVGIQSNKKCIQGFTYVYRYLEDNIPKKLSSVDISKLEKKVKSQGLPWFELSKCEVEV